MSAAPPPGAAAGRPLLRRLVGLAALLVLGTVAAVRLPVTYLPRRSFPQLTVRLALPDKGDLSEVTQDWWLPVESRVRGLGEVRGLAGITAADGGEMVARFAPGVDAEAKAARLDAELVTLRRALPGGGSLVVTPAGADEADLLAVVWVRGRCDDPATWKLAERVRATAGVRGVELYGGCPEELTVSPHGALAASDVRLDRLETALAGATRTSLLGETGERGRRLPIYVAPSLAGDPDATAIARLPVIAGEGAVPLAAVAEVASRRRATDLGTHFGGVPARALFVRRDPAASPLAVDDALRQTLRRAGSAAEIGWSEADGLRTLLHRSAIALLVAALLAALAGWWLGGALAAACLALAPALLVCVALNAFWLARLPLDQTTLVGLALGVLATFPAVLRRVLGPLGGVGGWACLALCAAVPNVAVALASPDLSPLLGPPALAFLLSVVAGLGAFWILPAGGARRRRSPFSLGMRRVQRDPGTALLVAATVAVALVALCGRALLPRTTRLAGDDGEITLALRLPEGATAEETERELAHLERQLLKMPEISREWAVFGAGRAAVIARLSPAAQRADRRERLLTRLAYGLRLSAALEVREGRDLSAGAWEGGAFERRADADADGRRYRIVLRGNDLPALREAHARIAARLGALVGRDNWSSEWGKSSVRLVLQPAPGLPPDAAMALAEHLRRLSDEPPALALPGAGERVLRVDIAGGRTAAPQLADLLRRLWRDSHGAVVSPANLVQVRKEVVTPRLVREWGRFAVTVEVRFPQQSEIVRLAKRQAVDNQLRHLRLPAGCDLERPALDRPLGQPDWVRPAVLWVSVPLLLLTLGVGWSGSLWSGLSALLPALLGLLLAAPVSMASRGQIDELTLFAVLAATAACLALAVLLVGRLGGRGGAAERSPFRIYRRWRGEEGWLLVAALVAPAALGLATLGVDANGASWVAPLRAAAAVMGGGSVSCVLLAPLLGITPLRRRRQAVPLPAAAAFTRPRLAVHSLVKIYGNGHRALAGINFELAPGVVGLLGPNGAGKTTLLRILTGLLEPTRGQVSLGGVKVTAGNLPEYRRQIGFLPQDFNAYPGFTAEQFLDYWAIKRGIGPPAVRRAEVESLLARVGLAEHANRKVRDFSGGMRKRVGIARALLGAPPVLIVDEPTTGLDLESRHAFRDTLLTVASDRIVVFSTHIASDVESTAHLILLLYGGHLLFSGTPVELAATARGRVFETTVGEAELIELERRHRLTSRVRTAEGVKVRGVAGDPAEPLPGPAVEPSLEEGYLFAIEGFEGVRRRGGRSERFAFLAEGR